MQHNYLHPSQGEIKTHCLGSAFDLFCTLHMFQQIIIGFELCSDRSCEFAMTDNT